LPFADVFNADTIVTSLVAGTNATTAPTHGIQTTFQARTVHNALLCDIKLKAAITAFVPGETIVAAYLKSQTAVRTVAGTFRPDFAFTDAVL